MKTLTENKENIIETAQKVQSGGVAIFMTDTIYGLHCDAENEQAIEKLYEIKKRDKSKSFILLIPENYDLKKIAKSISGKAETIIKNFWPGPLTLIFETRENSTLASIVKERGTIAVRMPNDEVCQTILKTINKPIISTSVNLSGEKNLTNSEEIEKFNLDEIDIFLKSKKENKVNPPSSILNLVGNSFEMLREGEIKFENIEKLLKNTKK